MDNDEHRLQARLKLAISCQRVAFKLSARDGGVWDAVPRDLGAAMELAQAALDEIAAVYGAGRTLTRGIPVSALYSLGSSR